MAGLQGAEHSEPLYHARHGPAPLQALVFVIDCTKPVEDKIMEIGE